MRASHSNPINILVIEDNPADLDLLEKMNQLFYNLLSNSLKFIAPDRTPLIKIEAQSPSKQEFKKYNLNTGREYCKIVFSDNGSGFDQEFSEQIFTVFQRLLTKDIYPGTGIGLS